MLTREIENKKIRSAINSLVELHKPVTTETISIESNVSISFIENYFNNIYVYFLDRIIDIEKESFKKLYSSMFELLAIGINPGYRKLSTHSGESIAFVKKYYNDLKDAIGIIKIEKPFLGDTSVTLDEKNQLLDDLSDITTENELFVKRFKDFVSSKNSKTMVAFSQFMNMNIFDLREKMTELNIQAEFNYPKPSVEPYSQLHLSAKPTFQPSNVSTKKRKHPIEQCKCGNFINLISLFFTFLTFAISIAIFNKI